MKKIAGLCLAVLLTCTVAQASDNSSDKAGIWSKMRSKIEQVAPKKKAASETVVGGVRGDKEEGSSDLYWKGENVKITATPEELEAFQSALKLAESGETAAAREAFDKFITAYPESGLLPDARQAIQQLAAN